MKFYSLKSPEYAISLEKIACKVNRDLRRMAALTLSVRVKHSMCSDLPAAFKNGLELMRSDSITENIQMGSNIDGLKVKIYTVPDAKGPKMAILAVEMSDFELRRSEAESTHIRLGWKMTFDFTEDHESAVWMLENLGNQFFWELEDMQPALIEDPPKDAPAKDKAKVTGGKGKGLQVVGEVAEG